MKSFKKVLREEYKKMAFNLIFAIFTFIVILLSYKNILLTTGLLAIITLTGLIKWKSKVTLIIFLVVGVLGTASEIIAIYYGIWFYPIANFINVTVWLFFVRGNAGAFIYQTSLEIKKLGVKK